MSKIDKVVLRETAYIAIWTLIFSALLQSTFLMLGKWSVPVLLGNVYGAAAAVLNFFAMGLSVQKALTKDPKDVQAYIKATGTLRLFALFAVTVVGVLLFRTAVLAVAIPLLFPRAAIMIRPFFAKQMDSDTLPAQTVEAENNNDAQVEQEIQNDSEGGADNE